MKRKNFPKELNDYIGNSRMYLIKLFHTNSIVYKIGNKYYLKITKNIELLTREKEKMIYLQGKLPIPQVVYFTNDNQFAYLLTTIIPGKPICSKPLINNIPRLISLLAEALKLFHQVDITNYPFEKKDDPHHVLCHGDFCLPNIMAKNGKLTGFIDLGDVQINDPWLDYAWCIWSLEYNTGTDKYRDLLLKELLIQYNQNKYEQFIEED